MTPELHNSHLVGSVLFVLGVVGFLTRRNLIVMFLSVELMLQAVALNLIAFSRAYGNYQGQAFTIFVLTVAACEAAIALVLFLAIYQQRKTLDVSIWHELGETDIRAEEPQLQNEAMLTEPEPELAFPLLTPAGREPVLNGQQQKSVEGVSTRA
ncbi:MAG: NADH-quinone oxidoreductase subunit NuoK [Pirellulales bacterium]